MTSEQKAAYIFVKSASMLVTMQGMLAENTERTRKGYSQAYGEKEFNDLIVQFGLDEYHLAEYCFKE